ncbi:MAG TPA: transglycosylase domain-containing protein [Acidimicrobiales bacterium]|nr:transglycosylase domain-containing protein [Acidimicrobiales bacterium]
MVVVRRFLRFVLVMAALVGVMSASLVLIGPHLITVVSAHRSDHERINLKPLAERSLIFDSFGNLQGTMTNSSDPQNRSQVPIGDIPETVKWSVIAQEDAQFYEHSGVNVRAILRAVDANLASGDVSQGGSTITQQVVKNSLVGDEESLSRKLREAFLAVELEKQMSKDEILERYLNSVYFGGGAYGVQAAAEYYFRKDVGDLNWAEGALLAALIRAPNDYDPFKNPELARRQRSLVFGRLLATERLTEEEVAFSEGIPLPTEPNPPIPPYDYFVEEVKQQLLNDPRFGLGSTPAARNRAVFEGGIRVYTTYDPDLQAKAIQARQETLPKSEDGATFEVRNPRTGEITFGTQAIASIEPSTGAVRVLVGGPGFERWQYNLATKSPGRQAGSTMKVYTLATLLEGDGNDGIEHVPSDTVSGGRCTFKFPGETKPYSLSGNTGFTTITKITQVSSNCGFMRLSQVAGVENVALMATRLGITSELYLKDGDGQPTAPPWNLTLGTMEVTPLDMAAAYAVFANDGLRNEPYLVDRIEDRNGKVIYQHQSEPERIVSQQTARLVTEILAANVTGGTGRNARISSGQPAAGKTGTTNDATDVWFVGYTPQLATAVWMGAPEGAISLANAGLGGATGGRYPAKTWGTYYSLVMADQPTVEFRDPESTRRGKSVGKIPYEVGGSSQPRSSRPRRTTPPGSTPPATSPPATAPPATQPPGPGG